MAERNNPTVEDLKAPLFAAVGAADLALERVNEIVTTLLERAGEARTDATDRVKETRGRIAELREDLPQRAEEIRGRLTADELREAALERLRTQPGFEERRAQAEKRFSETVELTQEALGNVANQTRAVGERAAKLIGREPAKKATKKAAPAKKAANKATAKKATAKKAPAKKGAKKVTQK